MENKGTIVWWVLIVAAFAAIVYFNFFNNEDSKETVPTEITEEGASESELLANSLAKKHGGRVLGGESLSYTIQAQDRLLSGTPVVFDAYLDDVFRRDGKTYVRFQSYNTTNYVLELECSPEMVEEKILSQTDEEEDDLFWLLNEYIVVANITEVSKPVIALNAVGSEDDAEIEVDTSSLFSAKGTCVDMEHLVVGD